MSIAASFGEGEILIAGVGGREKSALSRAHVLLGKTSPGVHGQECISLCPLLHSCETQYECYKSSARTMLYTTHAILYLQHKQPTCTNIK